MDKRMKGINDTSYLRSADEVESQIQTLVYQRFDEHVVPG